MDSLTFLQTIIPLSPLSNAKFPPVRSHFFRRSSYGGSWGIHKTTIPEGQIGSLRVFGIIHVVACYSPFFLVDNWIIPHFSIILDVCWEMFNPNHHKNTFNMEKHPQNGCGDNESQFFHSEITLTFVVPTGPPVFVRNMDKILSVPSLHHCIALIYMCIYIYIICTHPIFPIYRYMTSVNGYKYIYDSYIIYI